MPPISGIQGTAYAGAAKALVATNEMKRIEKALQQPAGDDGVSLVRDILGSGFTIEAAAARRGDRDKVRVSWWGGTFRRCLRHLAEICGFAVQCAYRNRHEQLEREHRRKREVKDGDPGTESPGPTSTQDSLQGRSNGLDLQSLAL
jgi:hypothetical protein